MASVAACGAAVAGGGVGVGEFTGAPDVVC